MIKGIHHISIIVSSEESVGFYSRLGFVEIHRIKRDYDIVVFMEGHNIELQLFVDPNHSKRPDNPECFGIRRLALYVDDIEKVADEFECGHVLTDWFDDRYCIATDPDGLPIEFHE